MRRFYAAFGNRDTGALQAFLRDATWRVPGVSKLAGVYRGSDEVLGYFGKLRELTAGTFRAEVVDILASEARAAVLARATGTREGKALDLRYVLLLEFNGDAIQHAVLLPEDPAAFDAFWS